MYTAGQSTLRARSFHRNVAHPEVTTFRTPHISIPTSTWFGNPQTSAVNRLPAHSLHDLDIYRQSLDGAWEVVFTAASCICLVSPTDRFLTEEMCDLPVPLTFEVKGLWPSAYANIQMPWDGYANPAAPNFPEDCRTAVYHRRFHPDDAALESLRARSSVHLRLGSSATALYVWVDGAFIGYCEDGYTASEFEVIQTLNSDSDMEEHELMVACYEYSSTSWLEGQDSWRFHGLFRSVYLIALPACHIENLMVDTGYNVATNMGILDTKADICGIDTDVTISAELTDHSTTVAWSHRSPTREPVIELSGVLSKTCPWVVEDSAFYTLSVALLSADERTHEVVSQRVGFCRLEVVGGVSTLNG